MTAPKHITAAELRKAGRGGPLTSAAADALDAKDAQLLALEAERDEARKAFDALRDGLTWDGKLSDGPPPAILDGRLTERDKFEAKQRIADLNAGLAAAKARCERLIQAWHASWDCSAHPGHAEMCAAVDEARAALADGTEEG